jgi:hypothetical protein
MNVQSGPASRDRRAEAGCPTSNHRDIDAL